MVYAVIMSEMRRPKVLDLASLLGRFADPRSPSDVIETCIQAVRETMDGYTIGVFMRNGDVVELAGEIGYPPEHRALFQRIDLAAPLPICDAIREQRPVWIESREQLDQAYPALRSIPRTYSDLAIAFLPLTIDGRTVGAFHVNYPTAHRFSADERLLLDFLAFQCAQALERTRLIAETEAANRRLLLLAQAGKVLAEARLDPEKVFRAVTRLLTTSIADACILALLTEDGLALRPVAFSHKHPDAETRMSALMVTTPRDEQLTGRVLRSGEPIRVPTVDTAASRAAVLPDARDPLDHFGLRRFIIVPIRLDADPIGTLSVGRDDDPRPFTSSDEALVQEVGHQAALAIDAARHFQEADIARRRLEAVLHQMPSAVAIFEAPSGRRILRNDQNDQIFRFPIPPVSSIADYERFVGYHEDGRQYGAEEWPLARSLMTGEVVNGEEIEILRGDQSHGFISVRSAPIRDAEGQIVAGVITYDDVTDRKQADILLQSLKKELECRVLALELLSDVTAALSNRLDHASPVQEVARLAVGRFADCCGVFLKGEDGRIEHVHFAHKDPTTESKLEEYYQLYPVDLDAPHGLPEVLRTGKTELVEEISAQIIAERVGINAAQAARIRELGFSSYIVAPLNTRERPLGAICFARGRGAASYRKADVAIAEELAARMAVSLDNSRLYEAIRSAALHAESARAEAERVNLAKDEFLAMLGHELRNPLAPMLTALELMRLRAGGDALPREAQIIERQTRHMVRLIEDLLDVSRITRGKVLLEREPVEAAALAAKAVEMVGPLLAQRSHALRVDIPQAGLLLHADPARMAQVIANLLANAAKYTPPAGHVEIAARRDGPDVVISVKDDGAGIAPDLLPRLFDLFVQGERTLARSEGGLGIGLTVAQNLVNLHGGSISAHSGGVGMGSEFVVRLPAFEQTSEAAPRAAAAEVPQPIPPVTWPPGSPGSPRPPHRILVVDDNRDAADLLAESLCNAGFNVRVAYDGHSALSLAAAFRPAAAILDIGLPEIDGYELTRRLRELPGLDPLLVIAVTGYGQASDRARSAEAGAYAHLVKPVALGAILDLLGTGLLTP
jgi:signal transduction histidine kinase/PAS domain-containing protein